MVISTAATAAVVSASAHSLPLHHRSCRLLHGLCRDVAAATSKDEIQRGKKRERGRERETTRARLNEIFISLCWGFRCLTSRGLSLSRTILFFGSFTLSFSVFLQPLGVCCRLVVLCSAWFQFSPSFSSTERPTARPPAVRPSLPPFVDCLRQWQNGDCADSGARRSSHGATIRVVESWTSRLSNSSRYSRCCWHRREAERNKK